MLCSTNALPSRKRPPIWPFGVTMGMPNLPGIVLVCFATPSRSCIATVVLEPASMAVNCTVPSAFRSGCPCAAIGPGKAASALGTPATSTPSARARPSRRNITPPSRADRSITPPGTAGFRSDLDQESVSLAAAGADRGEAEAAAVAAELVHHGAEDAAAARADRMPERDRPAVHV